ncbi:MAG: single-stranded-DNA-specific exonuclease RecJ [Oscillospiraceae bacterium]
MNCKEWKIPLLSDFAPEALVGSGYTPLLSAILSARGIKTPSAAKAYLMRGEDLMCDPLLLEDMNKAVSRIELAEARHEKLAVYGDYDVDGITASCLLCDYLLSRGIDCEVYIPDRLNEGYGVNREAITALHERGIGLVITVDCGITALEETQFATSLGMDIIITDHHECPQLLPEAVAVIDPRRHNSNYPFDCLAGVGVAFKLVCALSGDALLTLSRYADLLAVGTIADVMPLTGENRLFAFRGLEKLKTNPRPGFAALLEESGAAQKPISASTVGFVLAPRINAAGRLCKTASSVKLLLSNSPDEASVFAKELCTLNRRRQELETEVWDEATEALTAELPSAPIVLCSESWHPGVVGIAASRLTEKFELPAIMICLNGGMGKGSCRSYGDFNLFKALTACSEHLESFGGHAFAAGLNILPDNIEAFRRALAAYYLANPPTAHPALEPELLITNPSILSTEGVSSLGDLEPCGSGNPRPLMCISDAHLDSLSPIGGGKHLRMKISKDGTSFDCVFFSHSLEDVSVSEGDSIDLCFIPQINDFQSRRSVQLLISAVRPSETLKSCHQILSYSDIEPEELISFRPERDELARIWRTIQRADGHMEFGFERLSGIRKFGTLEPVKICLCLRIFNELKLLSLDEQNGRVSVLIRDNAEKTALENSPLFRLLWRSKLSAI